MCCSFGWSCSPKQEKVEAASRSGNLQKTWPATSYAGVIPDQKGRLRSGQGDDRLPYPGPVVRLSWAMRDAGGSS